MIQDTGPPDIKLNITMLHSLQPAQKSAPSQAFIDCNAQSSTGLTRILLQIGCIKINESDEGYSNMVGPLSQDPTYLKASFVRFLSSTPFKGTSAQPLKNVNPS